MNIIALIFITWGILVFVSVVLLFLRKDADYCLAELSLFLKPSKNFWINVFSFILLMIILPFTIPYSLDKIWGNSN